MNRLICDNLIISAGEFMVLSALCGITKVDFPMKKRQEIPDQKEVNLILFQLYQKQILRMDGQHTCSLNPEIKKIFEGIKKAVYEVQIHSLEKQNPLVVFAGKEPVVAELSENDREALKFHCISGESFLKELRTRNILPSEKEPKSGVSLQEENPELYEQIRKKYQTFIQNAHVDHAGLLECLKQRELRAFFIIRDRQSDTEKAVVLLLDCGIWDCTVYMEPGHMEISYYTEREMQEILLG